VVNQRVAQFGRHQRGVAGLGQRVAQQFGEFLARSGFGNQSRADPAGQRHQVGMPQPFQEPAVSGQHHGQQRLGVEVGAGEEPQLAQHFHAHFLGFVDQQHRLEAGGGQVGPPAFAESFEPSPTVPRGELHREDVPQFPIEVGGAGLRPLEHADHHVAERRQALGDDPQGHRLAGPRLAADEREAAFLDQLLDAPDEVLDRGGHQQSLAGKLRRERVPFESPQR
jgi:hypothetical protein